MRKVRLLFITPAAQRSGAPMLMLHLLRWVAKQSDYEISAVLVSNGAMSEEIAAALPTRTFEQTYSSGLVRLILRIPSIARLFRAATVARCRLVVDGWPPDMVYCNSAGAAGVLDALGPYECPVVINVHELEYALGIISKTPGETIERLKRHATHFIAGSEAVKLNLVDRHRVPADRVSVVHDFIEADQFTPRNASVAQEPISSLARFGVPAGAAVIGAIATVEWRKGADLLVPLARLLPKADAAGRPIHLVWVGGGQGIDVAQLKFDVATAGLGDRIHIVGPTSRTADWYPSFDVFALLSREDPFPLVALEAAASGVPILCFTDGGGMPEFVEHDCGIVVPFLDLAALAMAAMKLLDDADLRRKMGDAASKKVRERHDVSVAAPQLLSILNQILKPSSKIGTDAAGRPVSKA